MTKRKLSDGDIVDIRELYASGDYTIKELAEMYGVAHCNIWQIIRGNTHKRITRGIPVALPNGKRRCYHPRNGINPHRGHLTAEQVMIIREVFIKLRYGKRNQVKTIIPALAAKFGVKECVIESVIYSRTWKHLPSVEELRKEMGRHYTSI